MSVKYPPFSWDVNVLEQDEKQASAEISDKWFIDKLTGASFNNRDQLKQRRQ